MHSIMKEKLGSVPPLGVRMPSYLKQWLKEEATKADRSVNYTIVKILDERMQAAAGEQIGVQAPAANNHHDVCAS